MPYENENALVAAAVAGDRAALEELLGQVNDRIFTLTLRMLGTVPDAEDATQDILLRIITNLRTFQGKSAFSTWATRIAINYLYDYRKGMFAQHPLTFEMYGADTAQGFPVSDMSLCDGVDHHLLAEELKLSCTNVLLQCLKPEERVAYVLGTMFGRKASKVSEEIRSNSLTLAMMASFSSSKRWGIVRKSSCIG